MSCPPLDLVEPSALQYKITHVFCPLQLPDGDDHNAHNDYSLAGAVASAVRLYCADHVEPANAPQWHSISQMLSNLQASIQSDSLDRSQTLRQLSGMNMGDILAFLIRAQNAAVIFRKQDDVTIFESFEVSPKAENVMAAQGKLLCSYPGPAIEIPNHIFEDDSFLSELANFLTHMNDDILDAAPTSQKAQSTVLETRDTTHPRYITELLTGILRSVGRPADVSRITKRTSLDRSILGSNAYKRFVLFFMCRLANERESADLSNDLLQFMSAKISRRLRKLGSSVPSWLSPLVLQTCTSLRTTLQNRWKQVQAAERASPLWSSSQLDFERDTQLSLLNSRDYICNRLADQNNKPPDAFFNPKHRPRGSLDDFLSSDGTFFEGAYAAEPHVTLYDVERAVEEGIDGWVDRVRNYGEACVQLEILGQKYSSSALGTYGDNPELLSVMLLTIIELWVALDKLAVKETPMLAEYSPEVPTSLLEELLLCKVGSLSRLRHVHEYLSHRHSQSRAGWSLFSPTISENTFSVRYYQGSSHLQNLKNRIEEVARREVDAKLSELETVNARHASVKQQALAAVHDVAVDWHGHKYHPGYCFKCKLERELSSMDIARHEWPLPATQLHAKAVVFELDCPLSFNMWRSATFHLLVDICSPPAEPSSPYIWLTNYGALQSYLVQHPRSRITLASDTKPIIVTHYSKISDFPATRSSVCANNGLTFYGFDSHAHIPISGALGTFNIRRFCTHQLQDGPYQNLQKYIVSTSHTSNEVLANQDDCHRDLSIHEYMAFAHLRSGGLLQWLNILRDLRARLLSFRNHDVHLLLAQAVSQVGPLVSAEWVWHQEILHPTFCYALLAELESLAQSVEASWLEVATMDTISFLLRRLLGSNPDQGVSLRALALLCTLRSKVFSWVEELSDRLKESPGEEGFRSFLRDAAAICRSTFDVEPSMIRDVLRSAADIKILLSSAILIHDHTPSSISHLPAYSRLLLDRDRRLSLVLESILSDVIQADSSNQGINLAVRWIWPDYRPGSRWSLSQAPNSRWFSCMTVPTAEQSSQIVHFNILDGSLLINGKPLGRLPHEILRHPLYNLTFGEHVLEVIPGDLPGMDYATRGTISNHQVYFSLRNGSDLVIQAKRKQVTCGSTLMELIPQEKLEGDLPAVLIRGHAHWLDLSTSIMEIRPLDSLWDASLENWKIDCASGQYHMQKGNTFLIDIRSKSWSMVSTLLRPLDMPRNLLVSVSPTDSSQCTSSLQLTVVLPRYGLSFFINKDGDLESRNMREMVYDRNQSIGTLFGLVNRIVIRPKVRDTNARELIPRSVLIPDGKISFWRDSHHTRVEVDTCGPELQRVRYQSYTINTELGCLTGNVSLASKLYCAYLHALTSGCDADPLTGRSGTEEALSLLQSASCWSIMKFGSREAELLASIAAICPTRTWYPEHLRCMQRVDWHDLPASAQHHELYFVTRGIKEHCERVLLFQEGQSSTLFQSFPSCDEHLLKRSALRTAHLFPSDSGSGHSSQAVEDLDVRCSARDLTDATSGEQRACIAATAVHQRAANASNTKNILSMVESWAGRVSGDATLSLQYSKSWLIPDLPLTWLKAYKLLRSTDEKRWVQLLFSLPAMAYASPELASLIPVFVAFASTSQFRSEDPPPYDSYQLSDGYCPSRTNVCYYVSDCAYSFKCSPERSRPARHNESVHDTEDRQLRMYDSRRQSDADATTHQLLNSWPCETPPRCSLDPNLYDVLALSSNVQRDFSSCYRNLKLKEHLGRVQNLLNDTCSLTSPFLVVRYAFQPSQTTPSPSSWSVTLDQLFIGSAPTLQERGRLAQCSADNSNTLLSDSAPLHQLINMVETNAINSFQHQYASALRISAECFSSEISPQAVSLPGPRTFAAHYAQCRDNYIEALCYVKDQLGPRSQSEKALQQSGQWPCITAYTLLRSLASNSLIVLPEDWKECLIQLVLLALELQRARRLLTLHLNNLREELSRELSNEGCNGWSADAHPDWLLIQLQGNFLIRRVQVEVASEMTLPRSGNNTAMQLNMGEGKSSVIVPIVVAVLANGTQLVRVIVPKALTVQMFYVLADRLGGLVNRRIYFLPFSRSLELNHQKVTALHDVMAECLKERGVLIVQPEHILSLKLVSVEKQLAQTEERTLATLLLQLQQWLHSYSRDILDESDEILHVRYQLVYTMGLQQHMEGFPERWTTTQQVLGLVNKHASSLQKGFPLGVEYRRGRSGSFSHLRILHADAGQALISWVVQDVIRGYLPNFNFGQLRSGLKDAVESFISCESVHPANTQLVKDFFQDTPLWNGLLLLRGLLASGILLFAFREHRWRVDYGLAPTRTTLAVPYRAKDVPAQRAEFGHPDIAIILTCLSYYYSGLTEEQLRLSFEMLLKQDDPSVEYDLWVQDCPAVPDCLRTICGVNIKSSEQWCKSLLLLFRRNQATIDFYLSNVVFPKEAKEFPSKLSCSGWDLAERKERLLTGFSGTNDGQYLLPLHITQCDPDHQRGTNAKVLSYLLQPENKHYMCTSQKDGDWRTTSSGFLTMLVSQDPEIRVLLDVGAQMLDLENYELAKAWLAISTNSSAAIYFNEDDELTVLTRDGSTHLFISSPFSQQLDQCVVYLDDAHTRGTDIKFPSGFRGAVMLGPKVTKDRLTQGCMRMRKLGHGHSIMFFAPPEIDRRIRSVTCKHPRDPINTLDILQWAIRETCDDIQQRAPHWAQQGMDHSSRYAVWASFCRHELTAEELSAKWLQPEAKKLEELYSPRRTSSSALLSNFPDIRQHCIKLGILSLRDVSMDEEQEREVVHEAERERQVERPPKLPPADHSIHPDVAAFIQTGVIPAITGGFRLAFGTLDVTSAATSDSEAHVWSPLVQVTRDFHQTVQSSTNMGDYLRPVMWVVSADNGALVILSPYEVNRLLPDIRSSDKVHLHLYTPRISKSTKPCDDLALYNIPALPADWTPFPLLMDQLNVFSGQLYLKDYETYIRLCRFLCVYARDLQGEEDIEVGSDGFISPDQRPGHLQGDNTFQTTPLNSLRTLMSLRRKGMRFAPTHMGKLLDGRLLSEHDFDDHDDIA